MIMWLLPRKATLYNDTGMRTALLASRPAAENVSEGALMSPPGRPGPRAAPGDMACSTAVRANDISD